MPPSKKAGDRDAAGPRPPCSKRSGRTSKSVGVAFQPFPTAEEKHYDALLDADEAFKKQLGPYAKRAEQATKKADGTSKAEGTARAVPSSGSPSSSTSRSTSPRPVSQENLERFSASCPTWLHAMLDPLSPDDARAYLTILYRLLYPEPGEMPAEPEARQGPGRRQVLDTPKPARRSRGRPGRSDRGWTDRDGVRDLDRAWMARALAEAERGRGAGRAEPDGRRRRGPRRPARRRRPPRAVRRPARRGRGPGAGPARPRGGRRSTSRSSRAATTARRRPAPTPILAAGIARVVAAMRDPFPKVAGGGLAQLRDGGGRGRGRAWRPTRPGGSTPLT